MFRFDNSTDQSFYDWLLCVAYTIWISPKIYWKKSNSAWGTFKGTVSWDFWVLCFAGVCKTLKKKSHDTLNLKGTVAWDFQNLFFSEINGPLGPRLTTQNLFEFGFCGVIYETVFSFRVSQPRKWKKFYWEICRKNSLSRFQNQESKNFPIFVTWKVIWAAKSRFF